MSINLLKEIVDTCLEMDERAIEIYHNLSISAENEELKHFWDHMSKEELKHVVCWKCLSGLVEEKIIPQIFDNPEATLIELKNNSQKILELSKQSSTSKVLSESFVLAFRLEFYLVHTALERIWHFYGIVQNERYNPEKEYENHIHEFIVAMRKFGASTIELEALGEIVERLWSQARSIAREVSFDELTGILNRRGFFNAMTSLSCLAKRNGYNSAILMIDIDHFKHINDTFGHQQGDILLRKVAHIIKTNIRSSDIAGRFGGEEFIVFLPQIENENVFLLAENLRKLIEQGTQGDSPVTVSIGGKSSQLKGVVEEEIHELIKVADKYLFEAKRKGRNQVIC